TTSSSIFKVETKINGGPRNKVVLTKSPGQKDKAHLIIPKQSSQRRNSFDGVSPSHKEKYGNPFGSLLEEPKEFPSIKLETDRDLIQRVTEALEKPKIHINSLTAQNYF